MCTCVHVSITRGAEARAVTSEGVILWYVDQCKTHSCTSSHPFHDAEVAAALHTPTSSSAGMTHVLFSIHGPVSVRSWAEGGILVLTVGASGRCADVPRLKHTAMVLHTCLLITWVVGKRCAVNGGANSQHTRMHPVFEWLSGGPGGHGERCRRHSSRAYVNPFE